MKTRPYSLMLSTLVLTLLSAAMLTLNGCSRAGEAMAATPAGAPPAPPVSVAQVVARSVVEQQDFSGRIEAVESAQVRARVGGIIDSIHFKPGALVKKGDVLFVIDPRSFQADSARLEAAVASSKSKAELARSELDRSKRLLADNAIAQRDFDERAASSRQLEAAALADQATLAVAKLNLDYTTVRAPFSGRIGKAEVTVGNLIDSSVVLTSLVSVNPVYVSFNGDEATFLNLGASARDGGQGVKVRTGLANEDGFPHEGRLDFVDNRIDPASGTVRMRAVLDNKDGALTPGLFARVQVGAESNGTNALLIKEDAIGTDQSRKFVYVVSTENKADYRVVELGPRIDGLRVVRSGLKPGDRIVVNGLQRVRPGSAVTPELVAMSGPAASAPQ